MTGDDELGFASDFVDANIGAVLEGRYLVLRMIGSGGMGIVYEAQHQTVRSRHAIKILHKHLMQRPEVVRRFVNEARAAGELGHPGIVRSTDMGKTPEGIPFVVFEYLEGLTLKEGLVEAGKLPVGRAVGIAVQVASALAAAHDKRIIHRDVKPENVFLVANDLGEDQVKLLDFGIAKFTSATTTLTSDGKVFGSPQYMAPEQLRDSSAVDERSDVYALGVMLFEMIAGTTPHAGPEGTSLAARVRGMAAPKLQSLVPEVPEALSEIVDQALRGDPSERYATMGAFAADLAAFAGGAEPAFVPRRRGGRRRWVLGLGAVATFVALAGVARFFLGGEGPRAGDVGAGGEVRVRTTTDRPGAAMPRAVLDAEAATDARAGADAAVGSARLDAGADAAPGEDEASRPRAKARRRRARRPKAQPNTDPNAPPMFVAPPR